MPTPSDKNISGNFYDRHQFHILFLAYVISISLIGYYFNPSKEYTHLDLSGNRLVYAIKSNKIISFWMFTIFSFFAVFPLLFINKPEEIYGPTITIILILTAICGLAYIIVYLVSYTPWPLTILVDILNIGIIIGLLAYIYNIFNKDIDPLIKSSKKSSVLNYIIRLIFYIPCAFLDFIEYIKHQFQNTTSTTWVLIIFEIITIGLRILLPMLYKFYNKSIRPHGVMIEEGPIYLNNSTNLGIFQNPISHYDKTISHEERRAKAISDIAKISKSKKNKFNYNYALSCWLWINPQPPSTSNAYNKSTLLLNYGNILKIKYNKNKIEIYAASTSEKSSTNKLIKVYETSNIKFQKWNNFVLNYSGGTLDIFINNVLVSSNINITPIMHYHSVIVGSDNGIHGGIKNIIYYKKVLSKREITSIYE